MKTHAWDFETCSGFSIKEKFESLYEIVSGFCVRNDGQQVDVYAGNEISTMLSVCIDLVGLTPIYKQGKNEKSEVKHLCNFALDFLNGYFKKFDLYEDKSLPNDVLIITYDPKSDAIPLKKDVKRIAIFNYPVGAQWVDESEILRKVRKGMSREDVKEALGEPEAEGGTSRKYKTPSIYKYGNIQLFFEPYKAGKLLTIWHEPSHVSLNEDK